jgi:hypothetical protein
MAEDKKQDDFMESQEDIHIDYGNIDVADIMAQIRRKIARQPKGQSEEEALEELSMLTSAPFGAEPSVAVGFKAKLKRVLLKVMRPFAPLIKIMVLPVYQELCVRLDYVERKANRNAEYTKLLHNLCHNLVVEITKLKIELENLKVKTRILEKNFELLGKKEKALEKKVFR